MSQRLPSITALHMLPVLPTIEFVIAPVFPASTELVTLEESLELIELVTLVELLESIELAAPTEEVLSDGETGQVTRRHVGLRYA